MNILQLLRLEWLKYRRNKTFIISLVLFAVFLPSSVLVILSFGELPEPLPQPRSFFNIPDIWGLIAYSGNWLAYFIFGFLGVYMITMETGNRTLRQSVINGMSRTQVVTGKLLFIVMIAIFATVVYMLSALALASLGTEPYAGSPLLGENWIIFRFFLVILSYLIFGFLVGLVTRSMGLGILIYFIYVFFVESAIRYLIHFEITEDRSMIFYPMNAVEDLTPIPFQEYTDMAQNFDFKLFMTPTEAIVTSVVYMILFVIAIYQLVIRRDL